LLRKLGWEALGTTASLYRPLDANAVRRIADAAFEVLAKSGKAVYSDTAFEACRAAGAVVDADSRIVRLPRSLVEDARCLPDDVRDQVLQAFPEIRAATDAAPAGASGRVACGGLS
jgi:hypothetical protein